MPRLHRAVLASIGAAWTHGYHLSSEVSTNASETDTARFDVDAAGDVMPGNLHDIEEELDEVGGVIDGYNDTNPRKSRVLLVDMRGPTGTTGDGVRTMGMLMDLKSKHCKHQVEVLSDSSVKDLKRSWIRSVAKQKFAGVHVWTHRDHKNHNFNIGNFHRIIIGAKLELLYEDKRSGIAVPSLIRDLESRHDIHRKDVSVYWDDVPFDRCQYKPEANTICGRVDKHVRKLANIAHKFYVLSMDDKDRMTRHMMKRGLWRNDLVINVWPMRIRNMWELLPWERFSYSQYEKKNLVTMMGNHHAVNTKMVNYLFDKGIVGEICRQIKAYKSPIKLYFMGGLAGSAKKAHGRQIGKSDMSCVVVKDGYVSEATLRNEILSKTRAVLNPFFENINSGISVKNFESIMMGVPFLTSKYGMHGLADEFKPCTWYPTPKHPANSNEFVNFFVRNVISRKGYLKFAEKFHKISPQCAHAQHRRYPQQQQCW